ncbi:MAG: D-aminoacylase [Steroidobacter sp.]|nr:D-aminoacylase [Steroidobacter sp.]
MLCLPGAFEWPLEHWHNDTFRVQVRVSGVDMLQFFLSFKLDERRQIRSLDSGWEALGKSFAPVKATLAGAPYDVIVAGGDVYDGSGAPARKADVAIKGDRIVAIGQLQGSQAARVVDARGLAVAPGFINMMSQATYSLLEDGRSQSDLRQGVTLELLGEGVTPGPLNEAMQARMRQDMSKRGVDAKWTTLGQFMKFMEQRGISTNVATTVGATSVREYVMGYADRKPTQSELENMQRLVREAMTEGAFGLSSALAYVPGSNADTDELIALASVAAEYGGIYVSHIRDEGDHLVESVEELIRIARGAKLPAEIFHLKAIGVPNWPAMGRVIERVEAARAEGVRVSANMYPYTASGTGFDVAMPPWVRQGGDEAWFARLRDPATRARLVQEMRLPSTTWSNRLINAGSPENIMILGVRNPQLEPLVGKTLGAIARQRQTSIEDTVIDLVIEDRSRLYVAYFMMSEDNLRRQVRLPWMSFGSDGESTTAAGERLKSKAHPRSYGTFARVLGHYVREEGVITLAEAVRRLSGLPASTLGLRDRGTLRVGNYADVVVFDPASVGDRATFDSPYEYARGMQSVFVNGVQVLKDGEHTGATPGRYLRRGG